MPDTPTNPELKVDTYRINGRNTEIEFSDRSVLVISEKPSLEGINASAVSLYRQRQLCAFARNDMPGACFYGTSGLGQAQLARYLSAAVKFAEGMRLAEGVVGARRRLTQQTVKYSVANSAHLVDILEQEALPNPLEKSLGEFGLSAIRAV
jgi:hypothetical protein